MRANWVCCAILTDWLNKFFRTSHNVYVFIVVIGVKNRYIWRNFFNVIGVLLSFYLHEENVLASLILIRFKVMKYRKKTWLEKCARKALPE